MTLEPAVDPAYPRRYDCLVAGAVPPRPLYPWFRPEAALALGDARLARLDAMVPGSGDPVPGRVGDPG